MATLETILQSVFTSPRGITLQPLMVAGRVALFRIDWTRIRTHRPGSDDRRPRHPVSTSRQAGSATDTLSQSAVPRRPPHR